MTAKVIQIICMFFLLYCFHQTTLLFLGLIILGTVFIHKMEQ